MDKNKLLLFSSYFSFPTRVVGGIFCLFGLLLINRANFLVWLFLIIMGIVMLIVTIQIIYTPDPQRLIKYFRLLIKFPVKTTYLSEDIESIQVHKISFDVAYCSNVKSGLKYQNYVNKTSYVILFNLVDGDKVVIQHFFKEQDANEFANNISMKLQIPVKQYRDEN